VGPAAGESFRAKKAGIVLDGSDTLELLALAVLAERRGDGWAPREDEVEVLLKLHGVS
jgi:hypothetical protein